MVLDYERFQIKSKKRKHRRVFFIILFFLALLVGAYFFISGVILKKPLIDVIFTPKPVEDFDSLWNKYLAAVRDAAADGRSSPEAMAALDELIRRTDETIAGELLDFRALVFNGIASFYRAGYEPSYETRLPYYNAAIVSVRRAALIAPESMKAQLDYMLGKTYYYKREFYYDLAQKYLETALDLGYKEIDIYEYLVLINEAWGETDNVIRFLKQAYDEQENDLYLLHLARAYKKIGRNEDAQQTLAGLIERVQDPLLVREVKFLQGEIYFDQGELVAAEKIYRGILETDATSAEAHFRLALILEKTGDYVGYRYELRRTLENDPGHSGARSRLYKMTNRLLKKTPRLQQPA